MSVDAGLAPHGALPGQLPCRASPAPTRHLVDAGLAPHGAFPVSPVPGKPGTCNGVARWGTRERRFFACRLAYSQRTAVMVLPASRYTRRRSRRKSRETTVVGPTGFTSPAPLSRDSRRMFASLPG